jgi:hypothetical protein
VDADQHRVIDFDWLPVRIKVSDATHAQRDVRLWIDLTFERDQVEGAPWCFDRRSTDWFHAANQRFLGEAVFDDLLDAAHADAMLGAQGFKVIHASHLTIRTDNLDNDGRWSQPRQFAQIHRAFGLSGSSQYTTIASAEWVDVSGSHEVIDATCGVGEHPNRFDTVGSGDAGAYTVPWVSINAHRERGCPKRCVHLRLRPEIESIAIFACHGDTQIASPDPRHEVDGRHVDVLGRHHEITFVFAVLIIDQHDGSALAEIFKDLRNRTERGVCHACGACHAEIRLMEENNPW